MSVQPSTEWGILTLDENPPRLEGAGEVHGLVSNKVPRSIALRGNSHYIGRVRRSPKGHPQTMIDLSYISSGHCCLFLRPKVGGVGIEAVVEDTSSNGTYVNEIKLNKKQNRPLHDGDRIFLYRAQNASPLGHTIMYRLKLKEYNFAKALLEQVLPVPPSKRSKTASSSGPSVAGAKRSGTSAFGAAGAPHTPAACNPADDTAGSVNGKQGVGNAHREGSGSVGTASQASPMKPSAPASGNERSVLELLDDQVALKKAAEQAAKRTWGAEKERLVMQTRSLRSKLEGSAEENQRLLTEKSRLQEQLAEASARHEAERAKREGEWEEKLKTAEEESEAKMREALQSANRQKERAETAERAAEDATRAGQRRASELKSQVDALTEQKAQHQQRIAEYAARVEKLDRAMAEVRQELAETLVKLSSVEAQLIEARETEQALRTRVSQQEEQLATCRQARAEVEGRLVQREKELEASEKARKELDGSAQEAKRLATELKELEAAESQKSKELEQALSDLDKERECRCDETAVRCKLEDNVAELTSTVEGLKVSLEDAITSGETIREENVELKVQLKEIQKMNRVTDAKLAETGSELERCRNRKDGVKGEALMMGRNMEKAKQAAHELSSSFKEHIAALLQHLEVPGGYVQLDSQVMHGAGMLDDDDVSSETEPKAHSPMGSPMPSIRNNQEGEEGGDNEITTTQVSPTATVTTSRERSEARAGTSVELFPTENRCAGDDNDGAGGDSREDENFSSHGGGRGESATFFESEGKSRQGLSNHSSGAHIEGEGNDNEGTEPVHPRDVLGTQLDGGRGVPGTQVDSGRNMEPEEAEEDDLEDDGSEFQNTQGEDEGKGDTDGGDGDDDGDQGAEGGARTDGEEAAGEDEGTEGGHTDEEARIAATMRRISSSTRLDHQNHGGDDEDGDESEFTVPPLDFGRGTRTVNSIASPNGGPSGASERSSTDGADAEAEAEAEAETEELTAEQIRRGIEGAVAGHGGGSPGRSRKRGRGDSMDSPEDSPEHTEVHVGKRSRVPEGARGEATNLDACERPRDCDDEQSESGSCGQFEGDSGGKDGKDSVANTATVGDPGNEGDVSIVEPGDALQPKSQEDDDDDEEEEGEVGMADGAGDGDEEAWEETVAVTSGNDVEDEDDGDEEITDTA